MQNENSGCPARRTSIGGQALIEGIMMRGPERSAMAVRTPEGSIDVEEWDTAPAHGIRKVPFARGIFNLIDTFVAGYKCLMKSAEKAGEEEEPTAFEKWLDAHLGKASTTIFNVIVTVLAVAIALTLFIVAPATVGKLLAPYIPSAFALTALEGVLKIVIFIGYLAAVTASKDIRRVFMYHGAEHKTIACYEHGEELIPENIRKYSRFHPRCGTSFILIVLIVSILVNAIVPWDSLSLRVVLKLLMLPVIIGISYEVIRFAGRHDNPLTRIISAPGLWLQRFTTKEPDDSMLEVAAAAMTPAIPGQAGRDEYGVL